MRIATTPQSSKSESAIITAPAKDGPAESHIQNSSILERLMNQTKHRPNLPRNTQGVGFSAGAQSQIWLIDGIKPESPFKDDLLKALEYTIHCLGFMSYHDIFYGLILPTRISHAI